MLFSLKRKKIGPTVRSAFWNCILMFFLISNSTGLSVKVMCKNVHAKYFIVRNKLSVYTCMCKNNSFPWFLHAKSLCCVLVVLQPKVSGLSDIIVSISLSVLSCPVLFVLSVSLFEAFLKINKCVLTC